MKYRAKIRKGGTEEYTKIIEATSRFAVYEQVQKEGGFVIELTEGDGRFRLPSWLYYSIGTGIKRTEIMRLAKNLSAMLSAGLALSRALSVIERQSSNKHLKSVVTDISDSIKKGTSFHLALGKYPKVFPPLFVAMVRAGEESGSLSDSLTIIGTQMERSEELIRKVKGAMIYPSIVISAVIIVAILMLIFVVPTLTKTFTQLGVQVPLATRVIVAISNFMTENVAVVFLGLVSLITGGIAFVRSKEGSAIVLRISLYIPIIGELVRETLAARASRTISSLLSSGVPVLDALTITKDVVHAGVFASVIAEAEERVKKGEPLSSAFVEHPKLYPVLMGDMLSVGEETGKVAEMLRQVAEFYETDVAERTKDLSTIIEPLLMLVIGSFVGIFAVSMIAPIYSLSSAF